MFRAFLSLLNKNVFFGFALSFMLIVADLKMRIAVLICLFCCSMSGLSAQPDRWQQRVAYEMDIRFDVKTHRYSGTQKLTYFNNSPDTLYRVFYHLYLNAFQPGSLMDVRSRTLPDPDSRVMDRIAALKLDEIGYQKVRSLRQNGKPVRYHVEDTILEVDLPTPVLPGSRHVFDMEFDAQVPLQIRRTGRMNKEGIDYSMAQWYPKMSEYDYEGWHANPYIAREFYGVWGDYDVKITLDASYVVAATGYLQDPEKIGHGYSPKKAAHKPGSMLTWHFKAPNVHDFVWAADPDYTHDIAKVDDNLELHFFYQHDSLGNWKQLQSYAVDCFKLMNEKYGRYPYKQYSIIQGGDGGMEYPMATLVTSGRSLGALVSVMVHESVHSWFQMLLGNNESKYGWMDEGFTNYAQSEIMAKLMPSPLDPHVRTYAAYRDLVRSGLEEPLTTHADHFETNRAYSIAAYSKGAIFLHQLSYIIGKEAFDVGMKRYFNEWKYKHPNPNDFKRIMEKVSGLELDWYLENWIGTTKTIDYGVGVAGDDNGRARIVISKKGTIPMPLDIRVTYKDGGEQWYYIPLDLMRGEKKERDAIVLSDWGWTYPEYAFTVNRPSGDIRSVEIDPSRRMADLDLSNNRYPAPAQEKALPVLEGAEK